MEREKLKALLGDIGLTAGKWHSFKDSGDNVQFCCPFHGERTPSAGIRVDDEYGKCFACGESFNLVKLVAHCMEFTHTFKMKGGETHTSYDYAKAEEWLKEKYNVEMRTLSREDLNIMRINDFTDDSEEPRRYETPLVKIAPFQSGKATHDYFFERGFTVATVKKFKIGWDKLLNRVTAPIFWEDGKLFGVIGRAILSPKFDNGEDNPEYRKVYNGKNFARYFIYDNAPIGEVLFPLNHFELIDDTAVLVEGQYDSIWIHQMGYANALSAITSKLSVNKKTRESKQIDILLRLGVKKLILMRDNDKAGRDGNEHDYPYLKEYFKVYSVTYPKGKTDPQQLTKKEYDYMIANKHVYGTVKKKIKRL